MKRKKARILLEAMIIAAMGLSGCATNVVSESSQSDVGSTEFAVEMASQTEAGSEKTEEDDSSADISTTLSKIDNAVWNYNSDDDVYYQVGIAYCENPVSEIYETAGIFVPGAYMTATDNGDGTYTCEINEAGEVSGYTAKTAPIVIPVNTPGYSAMSAPTDYESGCADYTSVGFIYYNPGCRGRDDGAPAGVTDLKAAVRYYRYTADEIPGDSDRIFTFGHSGGGAQSALMGTTGDSDLYAQYLEEIGAVSGVSDSICGAMCWCPITNLDEGDAAYEWNLGSSRTGLSDEEQAVSDALAESYVTYINNAGFVNKDGNALTLDDETSGSYYDYVKGVIETSLSDFLADTEFPYDASASSSGEGDFGGAPGGDDAGGPPDMDGEAPPDMSGDGPSDMGGGAPSDMDNAAASETEDTSSETTASDSADADEVNYEDIDDISRNEDASASSSLDLDGTYETAADYIDALNAEAEWVSYDESTGEVTITDIATFVSYFKGASKNLGAFDQFDRSQGENTLFGFGDGEGAHFDATLSGILENLGSDYASDYADDLAKTDTMGTDMQTRMNMYTPLYYLLESEEGFGTSTVAKYWRIRTGIEQGDTSLSTEINLALALNAYEGVESVDFTSVWGQGHTQAERTGSYKENFIAWVNECIAGE